uniref:Proteasome inhibitor PI31 subunit n=1 Tax=Panstrongylus megistus TaxID=65343 RepID=A0A069DYC4_9HEMI
MSDIFGWDLIYTITVEDLQKKEDVLTLLIHFLMIKAGYKCIGLGDDKSFPGNECAGETLPARWNSTNFYSMRYVLNDDLYILRGVPIDDNIVYNLLRVDTLAVTNVAFNVNHTVQETRGPLETLFKNKASELIEKIRLELLNTGPGKEASTQTTASAGNSTSIQQRQTGTSPSPPYHSPLQVPRPPAAYPEPLWADPERDPLRVGRTDLDPFAAGGGGMIFNPFAGPRGVGPDPGMGIPGGLPRGSVPPGARFDPFGPPVPHPRPRHPPPDDDQI